MYAIIRITPAFRGKIRGLIFKKGGHHLKKVSVYNETS